MKQRINKPIFNVEICEEKPKNNELRVLAFAGIGYPLKFYNSLMRCGLTIAKTYDFADHHFYTRDELQNIITEAKKDDLVIYTTAKDIVKIPTDFKPYFNVLNIQARFSNEQAFLSFLEAHHVI